MTLVDQASITTPAGSVNGVSKADDVDLDRVEAVAPGAPQSNLFTSSDGLRFQLYKVNPHLIVEAGRQLREPPIPVVFIEDKGRSEENPNDPDYQTALQEFQLERGLLVVNTHLAFGTKLLNPGELPDGKYPLDDPTWAEDLQETLGILVPAKGKARYLRWLKFHLLDGDDMNEIASAVMRYSGRVTEGDVEQAENTFRDNESGSTDPGLSAGTEVRSTDSDKSTS